MVKQTALKKLFQKGEQRKGLLADTEREDPDDGGVDQDEDDFFTSTAANAAFNDDFPIEPAKVNEVFEGDVFADFVPNNEETEGRDYFADFPADVAGFPAEVDEKPGEPGGGGVLLDFPAAREDNQENECDHSDNDEGFALEGMNDFDGFDASFSGLDKAVEAIKDGGKKNKKGVVTKIFKKMGNEVPVRHSAEIVVDKTKIPTAKVASEIKDGQLVVSEQEQVPEKEKGSKSRFKSLKEKIVSKATGIVGPTREMLQDVDSVVDGINAKEKPGIADQEVDGQQAETEDMSENSNDVGEGVQFDPNKAEEDPLSEKTDEAISSGSPQTPRRAHRRRDGRPDRGRRTSEVLKTDSQDSRTPRHRNPDRQSDRTRRQSLLEKHQASPNKPKMHQPHKHEAEAHNEDMNRAENSERTGEAWLDSSIMNESSHEDNRMADTSTGQHDSSSFNPADTRKPTNRTLSAGKTRRRTVSGSDPLTSASAHRPRRVNLDMAQQQRRAKSTWHLVSPKADSPSSAVHRQSMSPRNLAVPGAKDHLGTASYHGRGMSDRDRRKRVSLIGTKGERLSSAGSSGGKASQHSHRKKSSGEEGHGWQQNTGTSKAEDKIAHDPRNTKSASKVVNDALSADSLSKEEVERLVRVVANQAKGAKSSEDLEAIVMESLHGGIRDRSKEETDGPIKFDDSGPLIIDEDDDITLGSYCSFDYDEDSSLDEDNDGAGLSRKDIRDKTRNYVHDFLKIDNRGPSDGGEHDEQEVSRSGKRRSLLLKNNYAQVFMKIEHNAGMNEVQDNPKQQPKAEEPKTQHKPSILQPDFSDVAAKLEEKAKIRTQQIAKNRAKAQVAK
jgi:hypothetical protein